MGKLVQAIHITVYASRSEGSHFSESFLCHNHSRVIFLAFLWWHNPQNYSVETSDHLLFDIRQSFASVCSLISANSQSKRTHPHKPSQAKPSSIPIIRKLSSTKLSSRSILTRLIELPFTQTLFTLHGIVDNWL